MVNLSLKLAAIFSLPILLLALIVSSLAQERGTVGSNPFTPAPYKVGERLTFNVSFSNFSSIAHIEIQVGSRGTYFGRDGLQLHAHVETSGVVNVALFAINNDYTTYVDPETGLPFHADVVARDTPGPGASRDFNQASGAEATRQRGLPGTYDFLSALYRMRALPLSEGSTYSLSIQDKEDYQVVLKISGRQVVRTSAGSFNTLVGEIRVANNSRANSYHLKIYFSDDERHLPVLVTARLGAGELSAELAASELVNTPVAIPSPSPTIVATPRPTPLVIQTQRLADDNDWPFKVGEQLNYQVFLASSNTPIATANFLVRGHSRYFDHDGLFLSVKAQTTGVAEKIFVANDQINSYVDPKALLPYRTELNLVEGKHRLAQILNVNQDYGAATTAAGEKIDIPVGTHDYLSFFYAVRTFNLNGTRRNAISILVNNKPKTLFIQTLKRETIELGAQKIPTIALSLTTDDPQSDKFLLRMWLSDDKRRLPLRITGSTEIGPFRADLVIVPTTFQ